MDRVDVSKEAQGGRDNERPLRLPNAVVEPVHPKAMPVILTEPDEVDVWLSAPAEEAMKLQRPLVDDALTVVARGGRQDPN